MIYYVEDDVNIRDLTLYALRQAGFEVRGFATAEPFFAAVREQVPEAALLDIMLPGIDGLQILRTLRATPATAHLPVMMLTAKGTELDCASGLDSGADDYLAKPFGMLELVSRVRALLRRAQGSAAAVPGDGRLRVGPVELDPLAHRVTADGVPVELTLKEFELLRALRAAPGQVLSRSQLFERVWGASFMGATRTVDVHVQTLRNKLSEVSPGAGALVETVRGVGYRCGGDAQ